MQKLLNYLDTDFVSSCSTTAQFTSFAKIYKKTVVDLAKEHGLSLVKWNNGHFYCSAFFKSISTQKLVYLSASDVRAFKNAWHSHILIRTAANDKDYSGGNNCYTSLEKLGLAMQRLTAQ
jgi:hypothetical protein